MFPQGKIMVRGDLLPVDIQRSCLACYVHRYTKDHKPKWAEKHLLNEAPYPVQFASDTDWLSRSLFPVKVDKNGKITQRAAPCCSYASWPDHPELRDSHYRASVPEYETEEA